MKEIVIGTAWKGGSASRTSPAGYGIKIDHYDRDRHFKREWRTVRLLIDGLPHPVTANIDKDSFWNDTCRELISADIGRWMLSSGIAPWPRGRPPKFRLRPASPGVFTVELDTPL
jgi:hypothetical protein